MKDEESKGIDETTRSNLQTNGGSIDPYELIEIIEESSKGRIAAKDFFPIRVGMVLEPLIRLLGFGNFQIRPSPFCGFVNCILSPEVASILMGRKIEKEMPLTSVFNLLRLFHEMQPQIQKYSNETAGLLFLAKLKQVYIY